MKKRYNFKSFSSIKSFSSAYELVDAWFPGFFEEGYEKDNDLVDYIKGFDAYETIAYYLVDNDYVMTADSITGDIFGALTPMTDFYKNIKALYIEDRDVVQIAPSDAGCVWDENGNEVRA